MILIILIKNYPGMHKAREDKRLFLLSVFTEKQIRPPLTYPVRGGRFRL